MSAQPASAPAAPHMPKPSGRRKRPRVSQEDRRRATRACDTCRKQKEKCEGGVPCNRCSRLHRMCQFQMSSTAGRDISAREALIDSSASTLPSTDGRERVSLMEDIIRHIIGNIPSDTENLRKIMESLQEADRRSPKSTNDVNIDDSEELSIADQEFTVKALSNNTTHYSGELSHWSFSKRVQERVGKLSASTDLARGIKESYRAKQLQSSGSTLSMLFQYLPPQPVSEYLISIFFKYAQTNYYYVEEGWALAKLESLYSQVPKISSDESPACCILLMLLAIGTQFADLDSVNDIVNGLPPEASTGHDITAGDDMGLSIYKLAVKLIPDIITIASIESVQAFLLLGVYTLPLDTAGLSYTYLGVAIKMAIQNGMHRKHSAVGLDMHAVEVRNRLWWTAYTLEKRICVLHGRPVSISQSDTDALLPSDLPEFRPANQPPNFANIQAMINLTIKLESVATSIVNLRDSTKSLQVDRLQDLVQHSQNLKDWWSTLPDKVYCRDLDPDGIMFRPNVHLSLNFLLTQVFLGRPFLFSCSERDSPSDRPAQSRASTARFSLTASCVEAAFKILDLCQLLHDNSGLARASYTEFSSCRAALLVILAQSLNEGTERLRNALTKGMKLMRLMARGIDSAKSELSLIETLEKAVYRLDDHGRSKASNSSSEHCQPSAYEKYKTWAQLWKQLPMPSDGPLSPILGNSAPTNSHDLGDIFGAPGETDTSNFALDGFSAFPRAMEGFCDFPMTNGVYQQDLGDFPDLSLEQGWEGYQMFDMDS